MIDDETAGLDDSDDVDTFIIQVTSADKHDGQDKRSMYSVMTHVYSLALSEITIRATVRWRAGAHALFAGLAAIASACTTLFFC